MRYFPVSIDTRNKNLLVLGGGNVATRKITSLLDTEFRVYVIASSFHEELVDLAKENPERLFLKGEFINQDFIFMGYDYLIIATNDSRLNAALEETAKKRNIPYLRCDEKNDSTFLMNKVLKRGDLVVSLSTGGQNPTLTDLIAKDFDLTLQRQDPEKIHILNEIRAALIAKNTPNVSKIIRDLYHSEVITLNNYLEDLNENSIGNQREQSGSDSNDTNQKPSGTSESGFEGGDQDHSNQGGSDS